MKRMLAIMTALAALGAATAFAACGGAHDAAVAAPDAAKAAGCPMLSKLTLTDEQKAKADAIHAKCVQGGCSAESCAKMMTELEGVLTPEQMAQCKAACEGMKAQGGCAAMKKDMSGCPAMKSEAPAEEK